jgi:hypothetical protein
VKELEGAVLGLIGRLRGGVLKMSSSSGRIRSRSKDLEGRGGVYLSFFSKALSRIFIRASSSLGSILALLGLVFRINGLSGARVFVGSQMSMDSGVDDRARVSSSSTLMEQMKGESKELSMDLRIVDMLGLSLAAWEEMVMLEGMAGCGEVIGGMGVVVLGSERS